MSIVGSNSITNTGLDANTTKSISVIAGGWITFMGSFNQASSIGIVRILECNSNTYCVYPSQDNAVIVIT